jgi:hypothetical protein
VQPVDEAEQERNQPPPTNPDPANPEGKPENAPD